MHSWKKRVKILEEGFYSSKFSLKITHVAATTLQLLAQEKDDTWMNMEENKLLYKFLVEDWAHVLIAGKGKEKEN